jgi:hypothetical protein
MTYFAKMPIGKLQGYKSRKISGRTQAGKGPTEKRAGRMACSAEAFFCLDVIRVLFVFYRCSLSRFARSFGTFLYQDKKGLSLRGNERARVRSEQKAQD